MRSELPQAGAEERAGPGQERRDQLIDTGLQLSRPSAIKAKKIAERRDEKHERDDARAAHFNFAFRTADAAG